MSTSSGVFSGPKEKRSVPAGYVPRVLCALGAQWRPDAGHDPVSIVQFKGGTSHIHFKCLDRDDGTAVLGVFVSDHAKAGLSRVEGEDSVNELFRQREFMLESQIH